MLLVVLAAGLVSYAAWRLLTAIRPAGDERRLDRAGYVLSAGWYLVLTWAALQLVVADRGGDGHAVERWSARLLGNAWGTIAVAIAGSAVLAVGVVFGWKAFQQEFVDDLDTSFVDDDGRRSTLDGVYRWLGAAGWAGRAIVTAAVGVFAVAAAVDADIDSAAWFDSLLRRVAAAPAGSVAVAAIAFLLVVYGVFCALSAPARERH